MVLFDDCCDGDDEQFECDEQFGDGDEQEGEEQEVDDECQYFVLLVL